MIATPTPVPDSHIDRARSRRKPDVSPGADIAPSTLKQLDQAVQACRRCPLWRDATQGVCGEGPKRAPLMIVGEQPGDQEDLTGRPFVGPAGRVLDAALEDAGIDRNDVFVTNAVKHFKHQPRGKRRLHKTPSVSEVSACRWWLEAERRLVRPKVIVAMGGTAALGVLARKAAVMRERGRGIELTDGAKALVTVHPSFLLRIPDAAAKATERGRFVADLKRARSLL